MNWTRKEMININMRCIEILYPLKHHHGQYSININMRCIEMQGENSVQLKQPGLTLT